MTADRPDIDLLADLDAGLLDEPRASQVRAAAQADPASAAVLDALAATRAELAALPAPPVPPEVAARWSAALAAERAAHADTPVGERASERAADPQRADAAPAPPHRAGATPPDRAVPRSGPRSRRDGRRRRPRPALVAGLLLVAVLVGVAVFGARPAVTTVSGVELAAAGRAAVGVGDAGEFADPARRAACLRSVAPPGVAADAPLLGGRTVELDGRPGVLLVLGTGVLGTVDVVVVAPGCAALLGTQRIGR